MKLVEMAWPEVRDAAPKAVAVLPIAATEQHGPHLAVSTDVAIASEIAARVEATLADDILLCPALPFGSSHHHLDFPGTLSLSPGLFTQVLVDLVRSLLRSGCRRIVLLNGHGGNITPARQALAIVSADCEIQPLPYIVLATYWELGGSAFSGEPPMESPALSHACEYETSMMLHLFPERVRLPEAARALRPASNQYVPWEDDEPYRGVSLVTRTQYLSSNGSSGEPQRATGDKGRYLIERATAAVIEFIACFKDWLPLEDLRVKRV